MSPSTTTTRTGRRGRAAGRHAGLALPVLAAALALTACSGGSSSSNSAEATPAAPVQSPSATAAVSSTPTAAAPASSAPASPSASATPTTAAGPTECTVADLTASVVPGQSAAGQRYASLVLTATSPSPCFVRGYPGLQLLTASGAKVPTDVVRAPGTDKRITLTKGQKAASLLHWTVVPGAGEPTDKPCEPEAATLLVTPPDETHQLKTAWGDGPVCLKGRIDAKPFQPGGTARP